MQAVDQFWDQAPSLFEQLNCFSAELARTDTIDAGVQAAVVQLASFIPDTPDPLADRTPISGMPSSPQ